MRTSIIVFLALIAFQASASTCGSSYTVQSGDICYNIAQDNGLSLDAFLAINPGLNCNDLWVGQSVCLSAGSNPAPAPTPTPSSGCSSSYTIQSGDICYNIAQAHGLSVDALEALNSGLNCNDLQIGQVICISGGSNPNPNPNPNPSPSGTITFSQFAQAVSGINNYPVPTQDQYNSFINNYASAGGITSNLELAMFLAEIMWESGGLVYKEEIACEVTQCPNEYRSPGDAPNLFYYGRGYIQLSWSYNYRAASEALYGDDRLVTNPDQVATDEDCAWQTSFWFWKANVATNAGVQAGQFGSATDCINGALECPCNEQCHNRNLIYAHVLQSFGINEEPNYSGC